MLVQPGCFPYLANRIARNSRDIPSGKLGV
uniref:Uncharacterized protein n=1 Tax=Romanomermis culicivorax TaxID=13658 RepID=A0A915KBW4_ROMCU